MKFYEVSDGLVARENLTWVGPVTAVKKSSGKGKDLIKTTVFNFYMKSGFQVFKTNDFDSEPSAVKFLQAILDGEES
jgi:hypothetical protein